MRLGGAMATLIEDYALLSDQRTAALVSLRGSVDWLCFPRFDSGSVFAALLGTKENGRWLLAPTEGEVLSRNYLDSSFVLRTLWGSKTGQVLVTDFMPMGDGGSSIMRRVEGLSGSMTFEHELVIRYDYGQVLPWVRRNFDPERGTESLVAVAGPHAAVLHGTRLPKPKHHTHRDEFEVRAGESYDFEFACYAGHVEIPAPNDIGMAMTQTARQWRDWAADIPPHGDHEALVRRSLLVLKGLTHRDTGGIVAAPTTSLPEFFGGERNWDYRFCWLRDAALTLQVMMTHGYEQEALQWRDWLLRAIAGDHHTVQVMYGVGGERELPERILQHLPGYGGAKPVRTGNAAVYQYQGDVVGEVMVALDELRTMGGREDHFSWPLQKAMIADVIAKLERRDHGLWEMRGEPQYFTHSRVMMWAALESGVRAVRHHGQTGDLKKWEAARDALRAEILAKGYNQELNSFTQTYDNTEVDASLLVLAQVGFVDYADPRMLGTVARIESDLLGRHGFVRRYRTEVGTDGLPPGEYTFMVCTCWLIEQYAHSGRLDDARRLLAKLAGIVNEVGLVAEEFDPDTGHMAGNFPQALSHLGLIRAADAIEEAAGARPARPRRGPK
ncbi:glycoside hydrolase family 15 protein [Paeniglutamicibacter sulfureus]|uniref:glycoside hydrolase family 15 protein n=1 Tax=Paeniglutamicibacter sulfureus TaxID=43666 RepID=UPI0026655F70|nr:glycoside hydrolase family 15 protein [Paeniglutamicibacter sulfureus]MDO2935038.1 glycoside hydrolase family 15 protein [Paeniglutamicibacter sulfureus]